MSVRERRIVLVAVVVVSVAAIYSFEKDIVVQ